jgi:hypothetical protein
MLHRDGARRLRVTADDRLLNDPLGRIEGRDAIAEGRDVGTFVRSPPHPVRLSPSWARSGRTTKSIAKPSAGRASWGPAMSPTSTGPDQACGPLLGVTSEDVEDKVDSATSSTG